MSDKESSGETRDAAFHNWQMVLSRLNDGDPTAASELFDEYSRQLVRLASRNIHPALSARFDGEDIMQSTFRTFFRRHQEGRLKIEKAQQLWKLLVTITICKTRSHARRHLASRRNVRREQIAPIPVHFFDQQALPEDALALCEEMDAALVGLPDRTAEILALRLEGKNKTEIAEKLNVTRQTIHRILKLLESRLIQRFNGFLDEESNK